MLIIELKESNLPALMAEMGFVTGTFDSYKDSPSSKKTYFIPSFVTPDGHEAQTWMLFPEERAVGLFKFDQSAAEKGFVEAVWR